MGFGLPRFRFGLPRISLGRTVADVEVLVLELAAVDTLAAHAIARGDVAALEQEVRVEVGVRVGVRVRTIPLPVVMSPPW